jgi:hypothetical protein
MKQVVVKQSDIKGMEGDTNEMENKSGEQTWN